MIAIGTFLVDLHGYVQSRSHVLQLREMPFVKIAKPWERQTSMSSRAISCPTPAR
ncbi:MAG: hypothetical protein HPY61_07295 [Methanotrichaceae archaeon]|nr:hypothetical protein [Methanotrichaceae archaeon]